MSNQSLKSEVKSVGRHSLIYMLGPALSKIVGFVLIPVYTRFIAPDEFGVMSIVDVAMTLTMMLLSMGIGDSMARFYYAETCSLERRRLVSTVLLGPSLISLPLILLIVWLAGAACPWLGVGPQYEPYLRIAMLAAWCSMLTEVGLAYLRMQYFAKTFVAVVTAQIVVTVSLNLIFVVVWQQGIWGILYSTLIVQAILAVALTVGILWVNHARPAMHHLRHLLAFGLPLVPSVVTLQLSNYLNPLMIRWCVVGDPISVLAQVGLFSAGQKIGVVVNRFVTVPFNAFWRPRRMELAMQDGPEVRKILARICTYSTLVSAQVALLISVSVQDGLRLCVDERYWSAYQVVPLIAMAYVVLGLEHHFSTGMYRSRRTIWATWIGLISLLTMVVANLVLLPRTGMVGAAFSSLLAISLRVGMIYAVSQKAYSIPFEIKRLVILGISAVALYSMSQWVHIDATEMSLAVRTGCGLLLLPTLWVCGFFHASERATAWEALAKHVAFLGPYRQSPADCDR